ncbi:unnamed protein product [Adineta ricciae]|uniref:Pentapeptide repeat-containing protein n=1 Tax=Adineta ricciae TaxID=249248 RepID=A0A814X5C0_ADIRI|nr:unnamed protein product [Adineta ricciae]
MEESHNIKKLKDEDEDAMIKLIHKVMREKSNSWIEWCQLIATICIPVIIVTYTIIQDRQNLHEANMSRESESQIAEGKRLNELLIAEENRQKDRDLAKDQQWENILVEYHRFLSGLLIERSLSVFAPLLPRLRDEDKMAILLMTYNALNQLDPKRKRHVIRALYEYKLIAIKINTQLKDVSILDVGKIDLSNVVLGSVYDSQSLQSRTFLIDWYYLRLPGAIFRNASMRHAALDCVNLSATNFDSADLSFAFTGSLKCSNRTPISPTTFKQSSFVNSSFYYANFYAIDFYGSNFMFANMFYLQCKGCNFEKSILIGTNLSSSVISSEYASKQPATFRLVKLSYATVDLSIFQSLTFDYSDWSHVQAKQIRMINCTFVNATMINASFVKGSLSNVLFQQTDLSYIDMTYAILKNISFIDTIMYYANLSYIKCEYCNFINIDLRNSLLRNASLLYSNFVNCSIDEKQVGEIIDLGGSKLPNETIVQGND